MDDVAFDLLLAGIAAVALAAFAWLADRRRTRRSAPDAVGFMPWTTLFFWSVFSGVLLLAAAWKSIPP
ncbi:MAG: hypothetical protein WCY29_06185 [Novosphingobium sp.]